MGIVLEQFGCPTVIASSAVTKPNTISEHIERVLAEGISRTMEGRAPIGAFIMGELLGIE